MRPATLEPARLEFTAEGTPRSAQYDDIYHSTHGALDQARHVFVAGNELPARFAALDGACFVIYENGFGLGGNFLATLEAWRATRTRGRLHYLASELHPLQAEDLRRHLAALASQLPELQDLIERLGRDWPLPLVGLHRLELADDVVLTLIFDESLEAARQIDCGLGIDAVFLDGFAPARNPAMWRPELLRAISRRCKPGATLATWCVAGEVRRALELEHWQLTRRLGFAQKREMLCGRFRPPAWAQAKRAPGPVPPAPSFGGCEALVIGAGLAGCWLAHRLAARGFTVTLIDRAPSPACGASGIPSALLRPRLARDDALAARLARAAYLYALRSLSDLEGCEAAGSGVLHLAKDAEEGDYQRDCAERTGLPPEFVEWLDRDALLRRFADRPIGHHHGAWWFPQGRALLPSQICAAALAQAAPRVSLRAGTEIARLEYQDQRWHALDASGGVRGSAPHLVLANALDALPLLPTALAQHLKLSALRGQLTQVDASAIPELARLDLALCGDGHVAPVVDGTTHVGASFNRDSSALVPSAEDRTENLAKLARLLGLHAPPAATTAIDDWVGLRCTTQDRLPLAGPIPDVHAPVSGDPGLSYLPRLPDMHCLLGLGARGLMWAPLLAELVASRIAGEPLPLPRRMAEALDPGRFYLRALRSGG